MGNSYPKCNFCNNLDNLENNPVFVIKTTGKRNNQVICWKCIRLKVELIQENENCIR